MFKTRTLRLIIGLLCLFAISGCGEGDSETSGLLELTVTADSPATGLYVVEALATYSNSSRTGTLEGLPITVTATARKVDGTFLTEISKSLEANSSGSVNASFDVPQTNEATILRIVARSGGLSSKQETVVIPSITAMTSSSTAVVFPPVSLAGATQTVTISGGTAPYTAQIDPVRASDIAVSVSGNSILLTKLKNSVTNGPILSTTLTVTDSSSATPIAINISYN